MTKQVERVHFEHPDAGHFAVDRLDPDTVGPLTAQRVLSLVGAAYEHEFESERLPRMHRLSQGRISGAFLHPTTEKIEQHEQRMQHAMETGANYWVVASTQESKRLSQDDMELDGLVKTTPSRSTLLQRMKITAPNCYVADIVTRPPHPESHHTRVRGLGSALLYTALKFDGQFRDTSTVVADTYRSGISGPAFFTEAGFDLLPYVTPPLTIFNKGESNEIHLPMDRREAEIADVVERLTAKFDWLATAEVEYSA